MYSRIVVIRDLLRPTEDKRVDSCVVFGPSQTRMVPDCSGTRFQSVPLNGRRGTAGAPTRLYTTRDKLPAPQPISAQEPAATGKPRPPHSKVVYGIEMWKGP